MAREREEEDMRFLHDRAKHNPKKKKKKKTEKNFLKARKTLRGDDELGEALIEK